jgi:hypothetical protein
MLNQISSNASQFFNRIFGTSAVSTPTVSGSSSQSSSAQLNRSSFQTDGAEAAGVGATGRSQERRLANVTSYKQDDPEWAAKKYTFSKSKYNIGKVGCTITATGNAMGIKPTDVNDRTATYRQAMKNHTFKDLSGNKTGPFDAYTPVTRSSASGQKIEERIKESLRNNKPVVIGMTGGKTEEGKRYPRHSVTAAGLNAEGKIMVVDGWRKASDDDDSTAGYITLDEAMKFHGNSTSFDMSLEVSAKKSS